MKRLLKGLSTLLLSISLLTCCGKAESIKGQAHYSQQALDAGIKAYVDRYLEEKGSGLKYDIEFSMADIGDDSVAAYCETSDYDDSAPRKIVFDISYWNRISNWVSYNYTTSLVFHELGHCDLDRDHIETAERGVPKSIMHPMNFGFSSFEYRFYVDELFGR